eukprot:Gb_11166 [translate_table: standard]
MDRPRHHRCNLSNANAQQLTCLLKDLQQCMQGASNFPQHINKTLTLPFQLSFIGEMQFRMAIIPILLKASLKQNRVIGEQQLNIYKQMEGQTNFQLMLEESADMYAGLELEYEKQKLEFEGLKYRTRKLIYSCAAILESVRALLQKERDLPELMALLQSKGIMVEAATDLLDSYLQHNTELVAVTIFLLQRISELADGKKALIELEMEHNRNNNDRKTLIWALIVLFCKQSNSRQNIVLIILILLDLYLKQMGTKLVLAKKKSHAMEPLTLKQSRLLFFLDGGSFSPLFLLGLGPIVRGIHSPADCKGAKNPIFVKDGASSR